jgi:hypothetical protein
LNISVIINQFFAKVYMCSKDFMVWVGKSYSSVGQYLVEAEERGCCRKIPFWANWMNRGETHIFLAHRDRCVTSDKGVLYT